VTRTAVAAVSIALVGCAVTKPAQITPCDGCVEPYSAFDNELARCHAAPYRPEDEDSFDDERIADHFCLSNAYLRLGDALLVVDLGGASRAYWAALNTIGKALKSRRTKEIEVVAAFGDLAKVAQKRGQSQWAQLLRLCGRMAQVYVDSREGKADEDRFDDALKQIEAAKQAAREAHWEAKSSAKRALGAAILNFGVSGVNANSVGQVVMGAGTAVNQSMEADRALKQATSESSQKFQEVTGIANAQFLDLKAGHRFVAERVSYYLLATDDVRPYVDELKKVARDGHWDGVMSATNALQGRRISDAQELELLGQELQALETEAVTRERRNASYAGVELAQGAGRLAAKAQRSDELKQSGQCDDSYDCDLTAFCEQGVGELCKDAAQRALYSKHDPDRALWFARRACKAETAEGCALVERIQRDLAATAAQPTPAPASTSARARSPTASCPAGQEVSADTAGHCCWPGQAWSPSRAGCVGTPVCPANLREAGGTCTAQ
jgi:hypothetical protein